MMIMNKDVFFIGEGSLLRRSVSAFLSKYPDSTTTVVTNKEFRYFETLGSRVAVVIDNPNNFFLCHETFSPETIVFSVNNSTIIKDEVLQGNLEFVNVHGGDTAKFRGHAEVCLVAAFIFQEKEYAVTLHELKAKQKVDEGPVIDKISWNIEAKDDFVTTMTRIQGNCLKILLDNFENVLQPKPNLGKEVTISDVPYFGYSNLGQLLERASNSVLEKKLVLGPYSHFFPRLAKEISNERYMRIR